MNKERNIMDVTQLWTSSDTLSQLSYCENTLMVGVSRETHNNGVEDVTSEQREIYY